MTKPEMKGALGLLGIVLLCWGLFLFLGWLAVRLVLFFIHEIYL